MRKKRGPSGDLTREAVLEQLRNAPVFEVDQMEEDFLHQGLEYWLNQFRREQDLTQQQLASVMGVSQSAVCQMLRKPSRLATLGRLVRALGGTLDITITKDGTTTSLLYGRTVPDMLGDQPEGQHPR